MGERGHAYRVFGCAAGLEVEEGALGFFLHLSVERGLGGGEFAVEDLLDLRGEFGGDGFFGAAQNVGRGLGAETFVEPVALLGFGAAGNLVDVAGHEDFEEGAEVVDAVFERRAGEEETALGLENAEGLGVLGAAVFEMLGFVGDEAGEIGFGEQISVASERAVRRDDEVVRGEGFGVGQAVGAVVNEDAELGGEAGGFTAPVFHE